VTSIGHLLATTTAREELAMSVATRLGIDDTNGPAMAEAQRKWPTWMVREPSLAGASRLLDLRSWTRAADAVAKDDALRALAKLGSATGDDDDAAITALTWALVPGAATLAYRLSDLANDVDELVAAQLWIAAKTFAWERRRSTAASILRDTMRGVQAELGVGDGARRHDRAWAQSVCVEPASPAWRHYDGARPDGSAAMELFELLDAATASGVITEDDRALLIDLAVASDDPSVPAGRGRAGLMTPAASEAVAELRGVSSRTVRRRAANAIDRLKVYAATWLDESPAHSAPGLRLPLSA
jgi:hypothetical protein